MKSLAVRISSRHRRLRIRSPAHAHSGCCSGFGGWGAAAAGPRRAGGREEPAAPERPAAGSAGPCPGRLPDKRPGGSPPGSTDARARAFSCGQEPIVGRPNGRSARPEDGASRFLCPCRRSAVVRCGFRSVHPAGHAPDFAMSRVRQEFLDGGVEVGRPSPVGRGRRPRSPTGSRSSSRNRRSFPRSAGRFNGWVFIRGRIASVSWISPPAPFSWLARRSKISGWRM